ncbi:ABC transporter permease subunit, partial [Enterococcus faecium]
VAIGKGMFSLVVALTAFSWAGFARIVRGEVLRMRELEFVQASRLLGAPVQRLILHHIGPNLLGLIIIAWSARIPGVIASEAFLSMLG